jgi:hypothetical protein
MLRQVPADHEPERDMAVSSTRTPAGPAVPTSRPADAVYSDP